MAIGDLILGFLNHQTESEKARLAAQEIENEYAAKAKYAPQTQAALDAEQLQALQNKAHVLGLLGGTDLTGYSMDNPSAGGGRQSMDTTLAGEKAGLAPSLVKTQMAANEAAQVGSAAAQSENQNSLLKNEFYRNAMMPIDFQAGKQTSINALADATRRPTRVPGVEQTDTLDNGVVNRQFAPGLMTPQESMMYRSTGTLPGNPVKLASGGYIYPKTPVASVPSLINNQAQTPGWTIPLSGNTTAPSPTVGAPPARPPLTSLPSFGTMGSSVGGQDIDTTPTTTYPALTGGDALSNLGYRIDENGQLQSNATTSPIGGPYGIGGPSDPASAQKAMTILNLIKQGKLKL